MHLSSTIFRSSPAVIALLLLCSPLFAQEKNAQAPDTPAASSSKLGKVNFPSSCSPDAQVTVVTGVALLHSFQYQQAGQTFRHAGEQDPNCAIAYWGKAMSLYEQLWEFPSPEKMKEGREDLEAAQKTGQGMPREREYISAAATFFQDNPKWAHKDHIEAYSAAMEKLSHDLPGDAEAAEFYALSLLALAEEGENDSANRKKAIAILEPLLRENPQSPGAAHYLIHAADTPELAPQGLEAARAYARIAPDSSHALHMPSHIFVRLGLWQETIDSNIAAAAAAEKATQMHMSEAHYQTHAMHFLEYAYLQSGQESKARDVAAAISQVPGLTPENMADQQSMFDAQDALELHHWKQAADLTVPQTRLEWQDTAWFTRTIGAARSGDVAAATTDFEKLKEATAAREAEQKKKGYTVPSDESTDSREARAWLTFAQGKTDEAVKILRAAAERQEEKGIDSTSMPAREMLADMLLDLHQPSEALEQYEAVLREAPNRFDALYGAAHAAKFMGDSNGEAKYFAKLVEISAPSADRPELREARISIARK
jgi:tetratricopeptide (TPR) repeat protein